MMSCTWSPSYLGGRGGSLEAAVSRNSALHSSLGNTARLYLKNKKKFQIKMQVFGPYTIKLPLNIGTMLTSITIK